VTVKGLDLAPLASFTRQAAPPFVVVTSLTAIGVDALIVADPISWVPLRILAPLAVAIAAVYLAEYLCFRSPRNWRWPLLAIGAGVALSAATFPPIFILLLPVFVAWALAGAVYAVIDARSNGYLRAMLVVAALFAHIGLVVWDFTVYQPHFMATVVRSGAEDPEAGAVIGQVYAFLAPAFGFASTLVLALLHRRPA
jgi:hypothetical protein